MALVLELVSHRLVLQVARPSSSMDLVATMEVRRLARRDFADLAGSIFRKPDIAIRPGSDTDRVAASRWDRKLGDRTARSDASNVVARLLREPQVAVRAGTNLGCIRATGWNRILRNSATGRYSANAIIVDFCEP
jgi:hypothetical protein